MSNGETLAAALRYAAAGRKVIPTHWPTETGCSCRLGTACKHPGKHPLVRNGKDDATTDRSVITEWWERWPEANVGLRPEPGEIVMDVDPRHRGATNLLALTRQHTPLTPTWAARTGGGGLHAVYSYGGPTRGALCPGVDLKTHGGYVIVEPSRHISGHTYKWITEHPVVPLPGWVRRLLAPTPPRVVTSRPPTGDPGSRDDGLIRAVAAAQPGTRNEVLNWAAHKAFTRGSAHLADDLLAAAMAAGLPETEARNTIRSAARGAGVTG